jgi:peptidyl-prolyl cis-trans isomerase C
MALNARKDGIDKDEAVARQQKTASDRVLADAWLTRQADAAVTDQALRARYDQEIAGRPGPEEVRARLILLPTEDEARVVIAKARDGADFAGLAKTFSKAPNADRGGDLGFASFDALAGDIAPVVFSLALGEVSAFPVRSPAGYFVIRVEGRRQRGTPTIDEARPRLEREIRAEAVSMTVQSVLEHIKVVPLRK